MNKPARTLLNPIPVVASLVIDYFRWTQLTSMVALWLMALLIIAGMLFTSNQENVLDILIPVWLWLESLPWVGEPVSGHMEASADGDGPISLDGKDLKAIALRAWAVISLAFMLLALIARWLFGPFNPWTLRRKLGLTALACVLLVAGFVAAFFTDPELSNSPTWQVMLTFTGIAVLLFIVSAWCLSIAHVLGLLKRALLSV